MREPSQSEKENKSLEKGLIELARVARRRLKLGVLHDTFGKHDPPRDACWPAEKFAIDEIGDSPEKEPDRNGGRTEIHGAPRGHLVAPGEQPRDETAAH